MPEHVEEIVAQDTDEDEDEDHEGGGGEAARSTPRLVRTQVYTDRSRSVINHVDSPDIGYEWTINPYRGCEHGCIYCYARPGHEYLGLSSGLDFETKIVAKREAPALLRRELDKPSWKGDPIVMSGVTDPYQPVERVLKITRGLLEVCVEYRQAVSLITKNALVTRDVDLLRDLSRDRATGVAISLTTLDPRLARAMEPRASSPAGRLRAMRTLADAGIQVTVMTAPIIPALNDAELPALLKAARDAGATSAGYVILRLPYQNKAIFVDWLEREFPERAARVQSLLRQVHGGELYRSEFKLRQRGTGAVAQTVADTFKVFAQRLGFNEKHAERLSWRGAGWINPFRRPASAGGHAGQMGLFV